MYYVLQGYILCNSRALYFHCMFHPQSPEGVDNDTQKTETFHLTPTGRARDWHKLIRVGSVAPLIGRKILPFSYNHTSQPKVHQCTLPQKWYNCTIPPKVYNARNSAHLCRSSDSGILEQQQQHKMATQYHLLLVI